MLTDDYIAKVHRTKSGKLDADMPDVACIITADLFEEGSYIPSVAMVKSKCF